MTDLTLTRPTPREIRDQLLDLAKRVNGLLGETEASVDLRVTSSGQVEVNPFGCDDPALGKRLAKALGLGPRPPEPTDAGVRFEWFGYVDLFPVEITIYSRSATIHRGAKCTCGAIHTGGVDTHGQPL